MESGDRDDRLHPLLQKLREVLGSLVPIEIPLVRERRCIQRPIARKRQYQ